MRDLNKTIQKRYNRISGIYNQMDRMIKPEWRQELLSSLSGHVLEVGVGTGANLPFYPRNVRVTGVDFSSGMLQYARNMVQQLRTEDRMTLLEMDVQQMTFPDDSFDYIVSTCVFCSVPDPVQGLHELRRVCKSDGKILMLEHMRSENPVAGILMDLLNPLTVRLWGANINRRTMENIARAGLTIEKDKQLFGTILRRLEVTL
ncbi:class I SAM-dependent methyltransferase [Sporolactobacillus laevolacticus]|uniref:class I SAM-dependent methyltransferase n=1 Tax=Sporolactobacillus laevolacticus TaxID=33018 RepID=UPI0025B509CD|nr:class I SAM-dependent methyltransferase [Sporolactobacillus laevolacticus]MDN3953719.1 class I SAM-dependent methyltransferase [Sporolactobacillus laevolacticus]